MLILVIVLGMIKLAVGSLILFRFMSKEWRTWSFSYLFDFGMRPTQRRYSQVSREHGSMRRFLRMLVTCFWQLLTIDACGGWEDRVEIPPDQSQWGTYEEIEETTRHTLRNIFSGSYPSIISHPINTVDVANFKKLQDAYFACLDEETMDSLGHNPLRLLLLNITNKYLGEFPCRPMEFPGSNGRCNGNVDDREDCKQNEGSLTEIIEFLQSIGVPALFNLIVNVCPALGITETRSRIPKI